MFFSALSASLCHTMQPICVSDFSIYRSFRIVLSRQGAVSGIALQNRFAAYYARRDAALMAAMRGTPPALGALKSYTTRASYASACAGFKERQAECSSVILWNKILGLVEE